MAKTTKKPTATSPEGGGGIPDRPSPCNVEAERGVIGAILLDPALCDDIATLLRPDDFYLDKNRRIYRALLEMHAASQGIDLTLLVEQLRANNELEEVGGEAYLAELMTSVQVTAHAQYYAKIVLQNATRRQLIDTCGKIINDAFSPEVQPKELISRAEEQIFAINDQRAAGSVEPMRNLIKDVFHLIDRRAAGEVDGVPTGFIDLDAMLGGLHGS